MKAQALRRTLTIGNALLVAGVVLGGGWLLLRSGSAQAGDPSRAEWVKRALDGYQKAARDAQPAVVRQVMPKDLEALTRPDLTDIDKGAPGVWPFVGPVPPPPKARVEAAEAPPTPTGLEALGTLQSVLVEQEDAVILFKFSATRKSRVFGVGDRIEDKDTKATKDRPGEAPVPGAPREPGIYLVAVDRAEGSGERYRVSYEVVLGGTADVEKRESVFAIDFKVGKVAELLEPTAGPGSGAGGEAVAQAAGAPPGATPGAPGATAPPAVVRAEDVRVLREPLEGGAGFRVEFDDNAFRYFRSADPDRLISEVKTEDVRDDKGAPKGVRVNAVASGSVANQFGVVPGDILKSINGTPVRSRAEAIEVVKALPKDLESVQVVIERNGRDLVYLVDPRDPKVRSAAGRVKFQPGGR